MATDCLRLFFNVAECDGITTLLTKFGAGAFASPYRSTVPLVALVKDNPALFDQIISECAQDHAVTVHFEYQVTPVGVVGNASHTDAMVFLANGAIAVEAKWTEPRYETVSTRLRNRVKRLSCEDRTCSPAEHEATQRTIIDAWLAMLCRSGDPLKCDAASQLVYQMVHRAASAAATHSAPGLLYLHFESEDHKHAATSEQYRADLEAVHRLIGSPTDFPFYVATLPVQLTAAFQAISELPKRSKDTDKRVRHAIASSRLFNFGVPTVTAIR